MILFATLLSWECFMCLLNVMLCLIIQANQCIVKRNIKLQMTDILTLLADFSDKAI